MTQATLRRPTPGWQRASPLLGPELVHFGAGSVFVAKPLDINRGVRLPLVRHVFFRKDGLDRALGLTGTAIDALVRFDVEHPVFTFLKMDAIHGTNIHACLVHDVHARFSYHVGHSCILRLCKVLATSRAIGAHAKSSYCVGLITPPVWRGYVSPI